MKIGLDHFTYNNSNPNPSQVPKYSHGRFCVDAGKSDWPSSQDLPHFQTCQAFKMGHKFYFGSVIYTPGYFYCNIISADTKCLVKLFQSFFGFICLGLQVMTALFWMNRSKQPLTQLHKYV